jgi:hypothetical protein
MTDKTVFTDLPQLKQDRHLRQLRSGQNSLLELHRKSIQQSLDALNRDLHNPEACSLCNPKSEKNYVHND